MKNESNWKEILEEKLALINWKLRSAGCDHYYLINNTGKETEIEFYADRLTIKTNKIFGENKRYEDYVHFGWIVFYLKDVEIKHDDDALHFTGKRDDSLFMTLKNVSLEWKKKRKIIR